MRILLTASALALTVPLPLTVSAHHSFAVFFDEAQPVTIEGVVTSFRFTNPHGTIVLDVTNADGSVTSWRAETNAPVVLQRRGWSRTSLQAGDRIRIDGWLARDGSPYMRLRRAFDADGVQIGESFGTGDG